MRVLATAVVRSSCGGTAIRYALPVLWMTSICTQWSDIGDANRAYTQNKSSGGSTDLTPRRLLKTGSPWAAPTRGRSLMSTIELE